MVRFSAGVCSVAGIALTLGTTVRAQQDYGDAYDATCPTPVGYGGADETITDECGVRYTVRCAHGQAPGENLVDVYADTFNHCFQQCSAYADNACTGFDYRVDFKRCYLKKNGNSVLGTGGSDYGTIGATQVAGTASGPRTCNLTPEANTPLAAPLDTPTCPDNTDTIYTDSRGGSYRIRCQSGVEGGNLGPQSNSMTFDACMALCDQTSGCVAVAFAGYTTGTGQGDCQMKDNTYTGLTSSGQNAFAFKDTARVVAPVPASSPTPSPTTATSTSSATGDPGNAWSAVCPTPLGTIGGDLTVTDECGVEYSVRCNHGRSPGGDVNLAELYADTFNGCFQQCSNYAGGGCIGFTYMVESKVCYLKSGEAGSLETGNSEVAAIGAAVITLPTGSASCVPTPEANPPLSAADDDNPTCPANTNTLFTTQEGNQYRLRCGTTMDGNFLQQPTGLFSFAQCLTLCDDYNDGQCQAVRFTGPQESNTANGNNGDCYLYDNSYTNTRGGGASDAFAFRNTAAVVLPPYTTSSISSASSTATSESISSSSDSASSSTDTTSTSSSISSSSTVTSTDTVSTSTITSTATTFTVTGATTISSPTPPCPDYAGQTYLSSNGQLFQISCDSDLTGQTETNMVTHESNLESCLTLCDRTHGCGAAVFEPSGLQANTCYLKPTNAEPTDVGTATGNIVMVRIGPQPTIPIKPTTTMVITSPTPPCPNYNGSMYQAPNNGALYQIACDSDFFGQGATGGESASIPFSTFDSCVASCDTTAGCGAAVFSDSLVSCYLKPEDTYITSDGNSPGNVALRKVPSGMSISSSSTVTSTSTVSSESSSSLPASTSSSTSSTVSLTSPSPSPVVTGRNPCGGSSRGLIGTFADSRGEAYSVVCGGGFEFTGTLQTIPDLGSFDACMVACDTTDDCNAVTWTGGNGAIGDCILKSGQSLDPDQTEYFIASRVNGPVDLPDSPSSASPSTGITTGTSLSTTSSGTTLANSITRTAPTVAPTTTDTCPRDIGDVCTSEVGNALGASACNAEDTGTVYSINCGYTCVGNAIRDVTLPEADSDRPRDFGYCQATCEANKPQCVAVNFVPDPNDYTGAGTCTLLSTIVGYSYSPNAYSAETVEGPQNPASTTASASSKSTSSVTDVSNPSGYSDTNSVSSSSVSSSTTATSTTSDVPYLPGGPSFPATDSTSSIPSTTTSTSSAPDGGYLPGGPSQPGSVSTGSASESTSTSSVFDGYLPGGPSQPASDSTTSSTSSVAEGGYFPGGPSQPVSTTTTSTSSAPEGGYLTGGLSQPASDSATTSTSSAPNGGYLPGGPSQPASTSTSSTSEIGYLPGGPSQPAGSTTTSTSSVPNGGYLPGGPSQPPNSVSSATASSEGASSQSQYNSGGDVPGASSTTSSQSQGGSGNSVSTTSSSQTSVGPPPGYYTDENGSTIPVTSSSAASVGPTPPAYTTDENGSTIPVPSNVPSNPPIYPGTPTNGYVFPTAVNPSSLPSVSVCPASDGQNFTVPVQGAGTYLVDCGAGYSGTQINRPAAYYKRQTVTPSQAYCMAVCDYIRECVGINVTPTECEYFSSVQPTTENRPGVIALLKTAPGTNVGPGAYPYPGGNAGGSSSSSAIATGPPASYPNGENPGPSTTPTSTPGSPVTYPPGQSIPATSSTTPGSPPNTISYPGQSIPGSSSTTPGSPPNTISYPGVSVPTSVATLSGSIPGNGSGTPPASTLTSSGTGNVITVTVTSCSARRTTTVFTTNTITTCAADSCPKPSGHKM